MQKKKKKSYGACSKEYMTLSWYLGQKLVWPDSHFLYKKVAQASKNTVAVKVQVQ